MTNPIVIDISHHQPDPIDWAKVKAGGTIGVIHKATEGTSYVDDKLFARMKAAKQAGLLTSTYHFLRETDMPGQMRHYLGTIDPVPGERVCLDHEHSGTSLAELEECVRYIMSVRPDLQITIYSGHLIEEQLGQGYNELLARNTSLWTAQYGSKPDPWPSTTWPSWSLWQHTDRATVSGINGPVDGNEWNGSEEALIAWLSPAGAIPPPPVPDMETRIFTVRVTAPAGSNVTIEVEEEA
jgi:lysozyme